MYENKGCWASGRSKAKMAAYELSGDSCFTLRPWTTCATTMARALLLSTWNLDKAVTALAALTRKGSLLGSVVAVGY
jgi:hypothetical protein